MNKRGAFSLKSYILGVIVGGLCLLIYMKSFKVESTSSLLGDTSFPVSNRKLEMEMKDDQDGSDRNKAKMVNLNNSNTSKGEENSPE